MNKTDGYVVSRTHRGIVVTALGDPPRDLGPFTFAANAAAVILTDAAGTQAVSYGPRLAHDLLAPLEDGQATTYVNIRRAQLESWLGALHDRWRHERSVTSRSV
jgi:hypothetical protein